MSIVIPSGDFRTVNAKQLWNSVSEPKNQFVRQVDPRAHEVYEEFGGFCGASIQGESGNLRERYIKSVRKSFFKGFHVVANRNKGKTHDENISEVSGYSSKELGELTNNGIKQNIYNQYDVSSWLSKCDRLSDFMLNVLHDENEELYYTNKITDIDFLQDDYQVIELLHTALRYGIEIGIARLGLVELQKNSFKSGSANSLVNDLNSPNNSAYSRKEEKESNDPISVIIRLAKLRDEGILTDEEFSNKKKSLIKEIANKSN